MDELEQSDVVRARLVEIVDDEGRPRLVLGRLHSHSDDERYGVEIRDAEGQVRAWLALEPEGPALVFDQAGNLALHAGVNDPTGDALHVGVFLFLYDRQGTPVLGWSVEDDGTVTEHR